ncbi:von Willebrand factor type A domain-containing protein [Franzmannia pantelleriensis]|uniref:von Willebrand factor type A domain-containing protein n=1 Tax=Franzmannia pantelleriensis TaxID=48727 RepID=A0A1G9PLF3_9GAMM|nr:VWA domain-containing protein [Halomonas pantelleriensis]SDL99682.1 von Willebrand factor type A domain-containing protein [Halomonas pantelleriensis]
MRVAGRAGVALLALVVAQGVDAYPQMTFSQEPNDTPEQAQSVSGEARLVGEVSGDDRDLFWWGLDDNDTDRVWQIELQGDTEAAIKARFSWPAEEEASAPSGVAQFGEAEPEEAAAVETRLLSLEASASQPRQRLQQLIVPPGEHLISLLPQAAGGEYQLALTEAGRLRVRGQVGPDEADDLEVTPDRQWFFHLDVPEHEIPLRPEEDAEALLWRLELLGELGVSLDAWIENDAGERIAEVQADSPVQHHWGQLDLAGDVRLHLRNPEGSAIGRVGLALIEDGQRPAPAADEQDVVAGEAASEEEARWFGLGETMALELVPRERQYLAFSLDESAVGQRLDVVGDTDRDIEVCLSQRDDRDPVCRDGPAEALFDQMQLAAGDYLLQLRLSRRADDPIPTQVRLIETDLPDREGWVDTPNDDRDWAAVLRADEVRQGRFAGADTAWFELLVSDETQVWAFQAEGDPIERLALYHDGDRRPFLDSEQSRRGDPLPQRRLSPVRLLPGRYQVRLEGENSDYRLEALPLGEPQPGREMEPNDEPEDANPLWLGASVEGHFHSEDDEDHFHFHLPGANRLVLDVEPPADGTLEARLFWQGDELLRTLDLEEATRISRMLPPGDYVLRLEGESPAQASYTVRLGIGDPWHHQGAIGFAQDVEQAPLVPEDGIIDAEMGGVDDTEGYLRLPVTEQPRTLHVEARRPGDRLRFVDAAGSELEIEETDERHRHAVTLPGGEQWYLRASLGRRLSSLTLEDPAQPYRPDTAPIEIELDSESRQVAPFQPHAQRIETRLTISHQDETPLELPLKAHASQAGWSLEGLPESLTLEGGEERQLTLTWTLPPELLESDPPSLFVAVGEHTARHDLDIDPSAAALDPQPVASVPEPLDGKVDLAWEGLGAYFVDTDNDALDSDLGGIARGGNFLIDGMASAGSSIEVDADPGEPLPPIRLAGDGGHVHGLAFNQRSLHAHSYRWQAVEISLGESLDDLQVVTTLELDSRDGEQFFAFDEPLAARYVQLRPLSIFLADGERRRSRHGSGELRVLGEPGGELAERHHDLLDRDLGGHWLYTLPDIDRLYGFQGQRYSHRGLMGERRASRGQRINGERIEMVFAFLQQRAARIDELRWIENLDWDGLPVEEVAVYSAMESPVGPWKHQADWSLSRDAEGVATLVLSDAPQVRYLRLVFDEPAVPEDERRASWRIPEALQALEADALGSGRSILGHWGLDSPRGPREAEQQDGQVQAPEVEDLDSHAEAPYALAERVVGRVDEPGDTRHYTLTLEAPDNTLAFELEEPARDRLRATLHGPQGEIVPLDWSAAGSGRRQAEAVDIPQGEYRLTVTEPPRSIVFLWDGSGSLSTHQPAIYQALNRFAESLAPDKEVFNMLPLGGPLLIDGWATQPDQVAQTLAAYDGTFSSSNSEPALALASRALAQREGQRAIFLITDAEQTGRDLAAWEPLSEIRPRIFSLEITHGSRKDTEENRWYQNQMLSWAQVADGRYRYAVDRTDLIRGFEAGMRELRQPSEFMLAVEQRYQEPPEPGSLAVVNADSAQPAVAGGVVHLIFDASGSMLRQMQGGRRIEVARRIVQQTLDERIPEEVPVALRAYGHTQPHSCETELLVSPSAGNHDEVRDVMADIQAINLARTPLAASIDAVLDDLDGYQDQPRLVVMLTDGEETCDGDVAASVDALIEEGVDVRLNIVGFHIDEIGLQAEFERFAAQGGGEYFDSHDGDELIEGLAQALAATWRVLDAEGDEVALGRVDDDPVELDAGEYELVVETQAGEQRRAFSVGANQHKTLEVGRDE